MKAKKDLLRMFETLFWDETEKKLLFVYVLHSKENISWTLRRLSTVFSLHCLLSQH